MLDIHILILAASSLRSALRQMEEAEVARLLRRLRLTPAQAWRDEVMIFVVFSFNKIYQKVAPANPDSGGLLQPIWPGQRKTWAMHLLHLEEESRVPGGHRNGAHQGCEQLYGGRGEKFVRGLAPAAWQTDDPCEDHQEEINDQETGGTAGQVEVDPTEIFDITWQENSPD